MFKCFKWGMALVCALSLFTSTAYAEDSKLTSLLNSAKQLMQMQNYEGVAKLLEPHELTYGGNSNYDYYLGTALLELKRYSEAIFALERALMVNPKFTGAMFELARAQYHSKDYPESKRLFTLLLTLSPPENIEAAATTYLLALSKKESEYMTVHRPSVLVALGYDTNANNSTSQETIQGFFLEDKNTETSSSFYSLLLSDYYSQPVAPDWKWQSQGAVYLKNNPSANFVDMQLYSIQTGLAWTTAEQSFAFDFGFLQSRVEGEPLSATPGFTAIATDYQTENLDRKGQYFYLSYDLDLDETSKLGFSVKYSSFKHENVLSIRDMKQTLVSSSYINNLTPNSQINVTLTLDEDNTDDSNSPYGNKRHGLSVAWVYQMDNTLVSQFKLSHSQTDYDGPFFGRDRKDINAMADWSLTWIVDQNMSYYGKLVYIDNHSSDPVDLYSYDKALVELGLSYKF